MTVTATDLDFVILEHLDFDLTCEQGLMDEVHTCSLPAKWVAKRYCCGFVILYCDKHRAQLLKFLSRCGTVTCTKCNTTRPGDDMVEFTPLKYKE